jgi:thioesterase domain-containing protein
MRKLWEDHITYTRNVIISFELNEPDPGVVLPDLSTVVNRLLQNQVDIGNAIKPYYGEDAGNQLTALLTEHITGAADVLTALKTNNQAALQAALTAWYANAHDIAVFLSNANPKHWPLSEMDQMMKDHLDTTTEEAVARHQANWSGDVAAYDKVHAQALEMADMLSDGIIAQFPAKFRP